MQQVICNKDRTLAMLSKVNDVSKDNHTEWFGKPSEQLQGSRMHYNKGSTFRTHRHILNPRLINKTQESFICIRGKIQIDIYLETKECLGSLVAEAGDIIFVWGEYHKLSILEDDTICYEVKAGSFTSVEEDKEFIDV